MITIGGLGMEANSFRAEAGLGALLQTSIHTVQFLWAYARSETNHINGAHFHLAGHQLTGERKEVCVYVVAEARCHTDWPIFRSDGRTTVPLLDEICPGQAEIAHYLKRLGTDDKQIFPLTECIRILLDEAVCKGLGLHEQAPRGVRAISVSFCLIKSFLPTPSASVDAAILIDEQPDARRSRTNQTAYS